jgi:PilZ domain
MVEPVYITESNTAVFRCPQCQRAKTLDVSTFGEFKWPLRFKLTCPCGHVASAVLEIRKRYRKGVHLPGTYVHYVNGQPQGKGRMTVRDLSASGMRLLLTASGTIAPGDLLKIEFRLDDAQRSLIQKKVIVRNVGDNFVGTEFAATEALDKALGFYLRS